MKLYSVDLTVTISIILAACSIVAPCLTTIITNIHNCRIRKLELKAQRERENIFYTRGVYEEYLRATGGLLQDKSTSAYAAYGKIYPLALVYFPEYLQDSLVAINACICENRKSDALPEFEKLAKTIHTIQGMP